MIKILFVCHGNICRSPMAEFVMKDMVRKAGLETRFVIESKAARRDELGNDTHYGTRAKLRQMGIPFAKRRATLLSKADYGCHGCGKRSRYAAAVWRRPGEKDNHAVAVCRGKPGGGRPLVHG